MRVEIDQPGDHVTSGGIDFPSSRALDLSHGSDSPGSYTHVRDTIVTARRIDDVSTPNNQIIVRQKDPPQAIKKRSRSGRIGSNKARLVPT